MAAVPQDSAHATAGGTACVVIRSMAGAELLNCSPVPPTVRDLKKFIEDSIHMPVACQKLLREDSFSICEDHDVLEALDQVMILVNDETPTWHWDLLGNPNVEQLEVEGGVLKCPKLKTDYTNVITREPISAGLHYFEFHLHYYGDEQWCGLTDDKNMAGSDYEKAIPSKKGWMYYVGRCGKGQPALEAKGFSLKSLEPVGQEGNVIGMLVDCDNGAVAFDLNGNIQGACEIPLRTPLWVLTHVDQPRDHVELRKPSLEDAPPAHFEALKGALLDVSKGTPISRPY